MSAYSFGAYLRSQAGFAIGAIALITVVAGIMAVTGSNASAIALVSLCEALFASAALAGGFLRDREFYQQLDLFCDSPENARYLSSILNEPRTLEGSIAYRALAVQGKAASDELAARSHDMKEYRNYVELWVHEAKTPIASAQLALSNLHGPEINKVRGDLDRIELAISDDGDGIPAADVPRVFDRGFTGSRGRTHHKATGMGLHLAAVACERMGLGLRVSSEEGTGTTVALTFPIDRTRMDLAANLTTS